VGNLASSKKENLSTKDGGALSMARRIDADRRLEGSMTGNIQSLVNFPRTQDALLDKMTSVADFIGELATSGSDALLSDSEKNADEFEYQQTVKRFEVATKEAINEQKFFFTASDDKQGFTATPKGEWLRAVEEPIEGKFVIVGDEGELKLIVNEEGSPDSYAAYVMSHGSGDVSEMAFDMLDFDSPYSFPSSGGSLYFADRQAVHELVYAAQARSIVNRDVDGDATIWGGTWFKEDIAKPIHGAAPPVKWEIYSIKTAREIIDVTGTGDESWISLTLYASGYVAVRYLHDQIKQNGNNVSYNRKIFNKNNGVKDLLNSQEEKCTNRTAGSEAAEKSGTGQGNRVSPSMADEQSQTKSKASLTAYINRSIDATNNDTGVIGSRGKEIGGETSDEVTVPGAVDSSAGDPGQSLKHQKIILEADEDMSINTDSSRSNWEMEWIEPMEFGGISSYNLSSTGSAALVISRVQELLDSIASGRSKVAANLSRFNSSLERLQERKYASVESLERIQGANLAEESLSLTKSSIRLNFSMAILAQANLSPSTLMLLL